MIRTFSTLLAGAVASAILAGAGPAAAAKAAPQFSLTLYDQPGYRGASVTFFGDNANVGSTGFTDRARSAQVRGTWRLCQGGGFRNRCEMLNANVPDLAQYDLAGRVGSAQLLSAGSARTARAPQPAADRYAESEAPPPVATPRTYAPPATRSGPQGLYAGQDATGRPLYFQAPATQAYAQTYARSAPGYGAQASLRDEADTLPYPPAVDAPLERQVRPAPQLQTRAPARVPERAPERAPERVQVQAAPQPVGADGGQATDGRRSVFFPRPVLRGQDVSAYDTRSADDFCRAMGLGQAAYFDRAERAQRAVDADGRMVGDGPVLRDVVCLRQGG